MGFYEGIKSWLALYLCALVDNGLTKNGLNADVGNSLYVDWETDKATAEGRAWAIKRGDPDIHEGWGLRYFAAQSGHVPSSGVRVRHRVAVV